MKKVIFIILLTSCIFRTQGQNFPATVVSQSFKTEDMQLKAIALPISGLINFALTTPILTLTPFTQVEWINGKPTMTSTVTIGYAMLYSPSASGVWQADGSITSVDTKLFIGGGLNYGVSFSNNVMTGSLPIAAIAGYSHYGLGGGIDILTGRPIFMVNFNFSGVSILQSTTKFKLK